MDNLLEYQNKKSLDDLDNNDEDIPVGEPVDDRDYNTYYKNHFGGKIPIGSRRL